ncbi:MAG: bacillithiol system redox-active protein YtxJ [Spirosomataceae bacterium]
MSATALSRFERHWKTEEAGDLKPYYLDLITYRSLSNQVAETFDVDHESPQALIIHNGESIFDTSHYGISFDEVKNQMIQLI